MPSRVRLTPDENLIYRLQSATLEVDRSQFFIQLKHQMAFLVCYSQSLSDHVSNKAIYLDQRFYKMIFQHCRSETSGFYLLREIAMLRYKSPTILIANDQLQKLFDELSQLEYGNHRHGQIHEFQSVCKIAIENGDSLTVSGDMYRELDS